MSQAPLFIVIHLIGLALMLGFGPRGQPYLAPAMAYPAGLAVTVVLAMILLVAGVPYEAWSLGLVVALVAGAGVIGARRRGLERRQLTIAAVGTLAFAGLTVVACLDNVSIMTFDSHWFVMLGRVIGHDHGFAAGTLAEFKPWGVFQAVVQSLHIFTRQDFLYSAPIVFSVAFVGVFAALSSHAASLLGADARRSRLVVALVTVALCTIYMTVRHMLYIHTNFAAGVYLLAFVALFWIAEVSRDPSPLPIAFLSLLAFTFQRVETPVFAVVFLVFTVLQSRLPRRAITPLLVGYGALVAGWYEVLARHVAADAGFLTPTRCRMTAAGVIAFVIVWLLAEHPLLVWLRRRIPELAAAACAALVALVFALKGAHMLESAMAWSRNLVELPYWGLSWYFIVALVFLSFWLPAPRFRSPFAHAVPVTLVVTLLLAFGRVPYRFSVNDSANRMMMHVLPLIFFYLGLKLVRALASEAPQPSQGALSGK